MNADGDFLFKMMISELAIFTKGYVGWSIIFVPMNGSANSQWTSIRQDPNRRAKEHPAPSKLKSWFQYSVHLSNEKSWLLRVYRRLNYPVIWGL